MTRKLQSDRKSAASNNTFDIRAFIHEKRQERGTSLPFCFPGLEGPSIAGKLIILIDDKNLIRECIALCLQAACKETSVASFATTHECAQADIDETRVSLVLYNVHHRRASDLEVEQGLEKLADMFPCAPVIVVSEGEGADQVAEALERGARGYIPTSATVEIAIGAAHLIWAGGTFVPASSLIALTQPTAPLNLAAALPSQFTPRQLAVLDLLREGKANREIARELQMSESTVKAHLYNIMQKLKAHNRTEVVYLTREAVDTDDDASATPRV